MIRTLHVTYQLRLGSPPPGARVRVVVSQREVASGPVADRVITHGDAAQMLLPVMMLDRFRSLHLPALRRQWFGLVCIGLFMVRLLVLQSLLRQSADAIYKYAA